MGWEGDVGGAQAAFVFLRHDDFTLVLLGVAVVLVVAWIGGRIFERLGQPPVIGEVVAGIALGPSLLGPLSSALFPLGVRPHLKVLSTIGVVVFMFLVGLELNLLHLGKGRHRIAGGVAISGTLIPFLLGLGLAVVLYPSADGVEFLPFSMFIGAAMSITAFPVLARILIERKLYDKPLGVVTMACAAGDDVLTWATLAFVIAVITSAGSLDLPYICLMALTFTILMVRVVRPRLRALADRRLDAGLFLGVTIGLLLSAFVTSTIGMHEILGAFLFGLILPRGRLAEHLRDRFTPIAMILLPMFFVSTGLNVDVAGIGLEGAWQFGLILLVACAGKFIGGVVGARTQGLAMRESIALGALMNTRGLTELIVLNIGREHGVIDDRLFTLLVLMALVTTIATAPLLSLIRADPYLGQPPAEREPPAPRGRRDTVPAMPDPMGFTVSEAARHPDAERQDPVV
jgi:Kef-type K+ transport system membrane component KefB